jgi:hypothetical protein
MRIRARARAVRRPRRVQLAIAAAAALAVAGFGPAASTAGAAETPAHTDVMLVFDTSGSMGGVLEEAKKEIVGVMNTINGELPDAKFGVARVEDVPGGPLSEEEYEKDQEKAWELDQPLTSDVGAVQKAIEPLEAFGGGDGPEAYGRALWETDTNPNVGWRAGARHVIILIADNVPHDDNLDEGIPSNLWVEPEPWNTGEELAGKNGIAGTVWAPGTNLNFQSIMQQLGSDSKPLGMVDFQGTETGYLPYWEYWAGLSGGRALAAGTGEVAAKLTSLVEETSCGGACVKPPPPKHPTASQVICNLIIATATDTCTATVADSAAGGATNPSGPVTFASAAGGVFSAGNTCNLTPTPASPNTSSCSVQFLPPTAPSTAPAITTAYSGDATHSGSTAQTTYGPASSLAADVILSGLGTILPGGTITIPVTCGFPCVLADELLSLPDLASLSSFSPASVDTALIAATHGKKKRKHKKTPIVLGKGTLKLTKAGRGTLVIRLSRKAQRAMRHVGQRGVRLTLKSTVSTINGTLVTKKSSRITVRPKKKRHHHKKH